MKVAGAEQLKERLNALTASLYSDEASRVFLSAARKIRDEARRQAPLSQWPIIALWRGSRRSSTNRRERGSLRRSIVAYAFRSREARGLGPGAAAQVNVRWGFQRAPHGHLVEFGTRARTPRTARIMTFPAKGGRGWVFARRAGPVAPNPFFRRAVERAGPAALDMAREMVARILLRKARP